MKFSKTLVSWYLQNKRDLPWRNTTNPYFIWLSEIILQQTRVNQGLAYYLTFIKNFPTVVDLASADEEKVLKLWQGLGYYSRARNLHTSAKYIVNELKGVFPSDYKSLLKLKGVGDYTASAIASICFGKPTAVVDGNVYRVLARYFGINTPINSTAGIKEFKKLAQELIDVSNPANHNQAIMEFGARMCKPQNPDCSMCPLNDSCVALQKKEIKKLPIKDRKIKVRKRYFNYLVVITSNKETILRKREGKGIWQNLYEFPLIESKAVIDETDLVNHKEFNKLFGSSKLSIRQFNKKLIVHKLSHQHINTQFWIVKINSNDSATIKWTAIKNFPVPILIYNFIEELKRTEIFSTFEI